MTAAGSSIPWTQLAGTAVFAAAREQMSWDPRRRFHNFDHVVRLYHHAAKTFGFVYDRALDLAILAHDVINDGNLDCELRSVAWLRDHLPEGAEDPDFEKAASLIRSTIDHGVTTDLRLVLLDLADFAIPQVADANTRLLAEEVSRMHGIDRDAFASSCGDYLEGLRRRFRRVPCELDGRGFEVWAKRADEILAGINRTRRALAAGVPETIGA